MPVLEFWRFSYFSCPDECLLLKMLMFFHPSSLHLNCLSVLLKSAGEFACVHCFCFVLSVYWNSHAKRCLNFASQFVDYLTECRILDYKLFSETLRQFDVLWNENQLFPHSSVSSSFYCFSSHPNVHWSMNG